MCILDVTVYGRWGPGYAFFDCAFFRASLAAFMIRAVLHIGEDPGKGSMGAFFPCPWPLPCCCCLLAFLLASFVHCSNTGLNSLDLALILGPLSP